MDRRNLVFSVVQDRYDSYLLFIQLLSYNKRRLKPTFTFSPKHIHVRGAQKIDIR